MDGAEDRAASDVAPPPLLFPVQGAKGQEGAPGVPGAAGSPVSPALPASSGRGGGHTEGILAQSSG